MHTSNTSRREFLQYAAAIGGIAALAGTPLRAMAAGRAALAAASRRGAHLLAPSVYTAKALVEGAGGATRITSLMGDGGNTLVAGGTGWAVLIDTKNAPLGAMLRRADAAAWGADFADGAADRLVINTHHHGDHTGGNWAFDGVPILAYATAKPRVLAQTKSYAGSIARVVKSLESDETEAGKAALPFAKEYLAKVESLKPEAWAPSRTVSGEKNEVRAGSLKIEAYHFGPGHTDNDMVLRLPEHNILHMGDLLFHNNWCFIDRPAGANTVGWCKCLAEAIKLCDARTVVIPGHGELTDVEGLKAQIAFFERAREIVGEAIKKGSTRDAVVKLEPPEFASRGLTQVRPRALGAIFDELTGVRPDAATTPVPAPAPAPAPASVPPAAK